MAKTDNKNRANKTGPDVSRRKFITKAMAGAGATTAIAFVENKANAAETTENRPIKIPDEFAQASKAAPVKADFPMTGSSGMMGNNVL